MNNAIYEYLMQQELLNILYLNCKRYNEINKYIKYMKFYIINTDTKLDNSCKNNHIISIKKSIDIHNLSNIHNLTWNFGLFGACLGNHMNIVKYMIKKGARNWNVGLSYACEKNNKDIVKLMIDNGADYCINCKKMHE